ncbi:ETS homologous factor-like isoform X2 [Palaemon carinicauda]
MTSFAESYQSSEDSNAGLTYDIESFARTDISQWTPEDSLDWSCSVCRKRGIDQSTVDLLLFRNYTGSDLLQFSLLDFSNIVGSVYAPIFHGEFADIRCKKEQGPGASSSSSTLSFSSPPSTSYQHPGTETGYESGILELTCEDIEELDRYIHHPDYEGGAAGGDLTLPEQFLPIKMEDMQYIPESVIQSSPEASTSGEEHLQNVRPDAKKRPRGPKNWEFVIRLLADPKTNPSLIRWEDQSQATFRLVQPTTIARMWGQRSNKPNLTYDNFARGLRYHYTTGALQAVSEKQLVYRCGPKALKFLIDLKKEGLSLAPSS